MTKIHKPWTEEEKTFAIHNYGPMTAREIGERINRSEGAVSKMVSNYNKSKKKKRREIDVGDVVAVKGFKTTAVVKRVLDQNKHININDWRGWVELDQPLRTFRRWHVDDLEKISQAEAK